MKRITVIAIVGGGLCLGRPAMALTADQACSLIAQSCANGDGDKDDDHQDASGAKKDKFAEHERVECAGKLLHQWRKSRDITESVQNALDKKVKHGGCAAAPDACAGVTCAPPDDCHASACNPADGTCVVTPLGDGAACAAGACMSGACVPSMCAHVVCGPATQCHGPEVCDPATGLCHAGASKGCTLDCKDGLSAANAAASCKNILEYCPAPQADGPRWLDVGKGPFRAYCDMTTHGGGYTLCAALGDSTNGECPSVAQEQSGVFINCPTPGDDRQGLDFLTADWTTAGPLFFDGANIISHGNFCSGLAMNQLYGASWSGPDTARFSTDLMSTSGQNPFSPASLGKRRLTDSSGAGAIGIFTKNADSHGYYGSDGCTEQDNSYTQGSTVCVAEGADFQELTGNLNGNRYRQAGDWMCAENLECGGPSQEIILLFIR